MPPILIIAGIIAVIAIASSENKSNQTSNASEDVDSRSRRTSRTSGVNGTRTFFEQLWSDSGNTMGGTDVLNPTRDQGSSVGSYTNIQSVSNRTVGNGQIVIQQ